MIHGRIFLQFEQVSNRDLRRTDVVQGKGNKPTRQHQVFKLLNLGSTQVRRPGIQLFHLRYLLLALALIQQHHD